jgi:pSer/pThr/pTyr-binding forkhead associated (FHA) protein
MEREKRRKTQVSFPIVDCDDQLVWEERRKGERRKWTGGKAAGSGPGEAETPRQNRRRRVDRRIRRTEVVVRPDGPRLPKILLDTGELLYELNGDQESLSLGRSRKADVPIDVEVASRQHAQITRLGDRFFLQDDSTNGTYLKTADGEDVVLRGNQRVLEGQGAIRLGRAVEDQAEDLIRFVVIEAES